MRRDGQVVAALYRLEEYLRKKLIASGWKENLKTYCKGNPHSIQTSSEKRALSESPFRDSWKN